MKGNITISKNSALLIAGALSLFAMADYVSLIDAKSAGGIVVDGATEEEIAEAISNTMPVGFVTLRMDDTNPADIYGGTWQLLTGDATLVLGDGTVQSGISSGNNDPQVPLVEHSHTRGTMEISGDFGFGGGSSSSNYNVYGVNGAFYSTKAGSTSYGHAGATSISAHNLVKLQASRNWTGSTSVEGVSNATLDVRGERLTVNIWQRIN